MAHILIVGGDKGVADTASRILFDAGYACGWLRDGESALEVISWRRPDLLMLDADLPGLSCADVLRSLRSSAEGHDLPVIMMVDEDDMGSGVPAGVQACVGRQIREDRLVQIVEAHLSSDTGLAAPLSLVDHLENAASRWRDSPLRRAPF